MLSWGGGGGNRFTVTQILTMNPSFIIIFTVFFLSDDS